MIKNLHLSQLLDFAGTTIKFCPNSLTDPDSKIGWPDVGRNQRKVGKFVQLFALLAHHLPNKRVKSCFIIFVGYLSVTYVILNAK